MASDWIETTLGDIAQNISRPFNFSTLEEVVFVNTGDVLEGKFLHSNKISKVGLPGQAKKRIEKGDILFSEIRPANKRFALVDFDSTGYVVSTKFMVITLTSEDVDSRFFYILLTNKNTLHEFQKIAESRSGTFPQITFDAVAYFPVQLPPLPEQKAIAHILGSLDDKIELNRQMNETLEAMAQALFKSWFVDFDPVIDNAIKAGKPIPDELAARAKLRKNITKKDNPEIQSLFPDEFEFTEELRWIPSGWAVENSGNLFDIRDGTHDSPKKSNEGKYLITSRHITGGIIDYSNAYLISKQDFDEVNKRSKVDSYDILLTMIGTVGISLIVLQEEIDFAIKNVGLFKTGNNRQIAIFFYLYLNSTYMKHYLESMLAGTTQKYLTLKVLRSLPVILSNEEVLDEFAAIMSPLFKRIHSNNEQIKTLANLRDTLLPKLMSGEIRVSDAAAMVEDA